MLRRAAWLLVLLPLILPMSALAIAALDADPGGVVFDARCVRSAAGERRITITNEGSPEARNVRVVLSPGSMRGVFPLGGQTSVATLSPDEDIDVSVGFVPVGNGPASAAAVVSYDAVVPTASPTKTASASASPSPSGTASPSPKPTPTPTPTPTPRTTPKTFKVPLEGSGIERFLATSPTAVSFGSIRMGQAAAAKSVRVFADGAAPVSLRSIAIEGAHASDFTVTPTAGRAITESTPLSLTLRFTARTLGARSASLVLRSNSCDGPVLRVPLGAVVVEPDVFVDPPEISFEPTEVGSASGTKDVGVVNQGGAPLTVTALDLVGDDFAIVEAPSLPVTLKPGAAVPLSLVFRPQAEGEREASLHVESNDPNGTALDVRVRGRADPPDVPATPTVAPTGDADDAPARSVGFSQYLPEVSVLGGVLVFFLLMRVLGRLRMRHD